MPGLPRYRTTAELKLSQVYRRSAIRMPRGRASSASGEDDVAADGARVEVRVARGTRQVHVARDALGQLQLRSCRCRDRAADAFDPDRTLDPGDLHIPGDRLCIDGRGRRQRDRVIDRYVVVP